MDHLAKKAVNLEGHTYLNKPAAFSYFLITDVLQGSKYASDLDMLTCCNPALKEGNRCDKKVLRTCHIFPWLRRKKNLRKM